MRMNELNNKSTTNTQKEKWLERLIWFVGSILISLVVIGWQNKDANSKQINDAIIRLDETKASKIELDQKCQETRREIQKEMDDKFNLVRSDIRELKDQQTTNSEDTKEILRYLRNKK